MKGRIAVLRVQELAARTHRVFVVWTNRGFSRTAAISQDTPTCNATA
jgi:hypothetical protein